MGNIAIVDSKDKIPGKLEKRIALEFLKGDDLKDMGVDDIGAFIQKLLDVGGNYGTAREIIAGVEDSNETIWIVPVASQSTGSQFIPEVPCVIFDFGNLIFGGLIVASADPKPLPPSVMLFHELGHAVQWIQRRPWFTSQSMDAIEADNLVKHEWPLCNQMNIPTRMHYDDIFKTRGAALERFEATTQAATKIQAAVRGFLVRSKLRN